MTDIASHNMPDSRGSPVMGQEGSGCQTAYRLLPMATGWQYDCHRLEIPMNLTILPVIAIIVIVFFGHKRFRDLADGLGNFFRNGPRGGPPTHPLPVTGEVEIQGKKNQHKGAAKRPTKNIR